MHLKFQLLVAFVCSIICVIGFSLISLLISDHQIIHFDRSVIDFVQGLESPGVTRVMEFFTFVGSTPTVIVFLLLLIFFLYKVLHHRLELILLVGTVAGSGALNQILKLIFHRTRPNFHRLIDISGYSFPSGHAMNAFTVYVMMSFLLWRHIPSKRGRSLVLLVSAMMILMIGLSRIYLGVHYPSDVVAGYLASGFWLTVAIWFFQYYQEKRYNNRKGI